MNGSAGEPGARRPQEAPPLAVVTGASSGIGEAFARVAAEEGFATLLIARRAGRLEALARELASRFGVPSRALALDLAAPGAPARVMAALEEAGAVPAVLVNNAGFGAVGDSVELDPAALRRMIDLNAGALTELAVRIGREMRDAGRGRILNVASTAAFQSCPHLGVYGATKAFVLSFSESLAEELRGTGVTVTALCPGPTATEFGFVAGLADDAPMEGVDLAKLERSAEAVARTGWRAMRSGRTVVIDGAGNAVLAHLAALLPRALVRRIAGAALGRLRRRDAGA